jgi:hypothetical protein
METGPSRNLNGSTRKLAMMDSPAGGGVRVDGGEGGGRGGDWVGGAVKGKESAEDREPALISLCGAIELEAKMVIEDCPLTA